MYIIYKGIKINYVIHGRNEKAIIFLHGWGGDISSFSYICQNIDNGYSKILLDFPPFGNSEKPCVPFNLDDYASLLYEVVKICKIKKIIIISHSFGSRVAICFCNRYTNYVERMIITGGAGIIPKKSFARFFKKTKYKIIRFFNKTANVGSPDYVKLDSVMKKTFSNIVNQNLYEDAKNVICPVLLIYGDKDKQTPLYMAKMYNKQMKNSHLIIFKNCGHFAYLENLNKFISIVQIFIEG